MTIYDAITPILIRPPVSGRQQLLFLLIEEEGGGGAVTADVALAVAQRSHVSVSVHLVESPNERDGKPWAWGNYPHCAKAVLAWLPETKRTLQGISRTPDVEIQKRALFTEQRRRLTRLAEVTGGHRLQPGLFGGAITGAVKSVLDEARQRYILYYTPTRVPTPGWHAVNVSVRRPGAFDVSSRPGYER